MATRELEQAACTVRLGPRRFSLYDTRVERKSLVFAMTVGRLPARRKLRNSMPACSWRSR
jgi:hypothetical protein